MKLATDKAYRQGRKESQAKWRRNNPGYWKRYRDKHPEQVQRNRAMQKLRNIRKRHPGMIAKMDALKTRKLQSFGPFYLVPVIAKMDASIAYICCDTSMLQMIAKKDSMASVTSLP